MQGFFILCLTTFSLSAFADPAPFPVFLKSGFSSIIEFDDMPTRVVLGDAQSFQVEKLDRSLVIKTIVPYATGNMFVYFNAKEPKLFILTASEDAEPTYYKRFEAPARMVAKKPDSSPRKVAFKREIVLRTAKFDGKKDYLTLEVDLSADSSSVLRPNWGLAALRLNRSIIKPHKLWAERKEIQKDSRVKARFIFAKPNLPRDLVGVTLVLPIMGSPDPFVIALGGSYQ